MIDDLAEAVADVVGGVVRGAADLVSEVASFVSGPVADGAANATGVHQENGEEEEEQPSAA
ncbi:hypothetical protein [Longispora albida]|uniref:hypothetical protein n=1 Tax=Longispora albida TaxID=203523 RepID=UPI000366761E|nr:hypothetical protein [Longispora albida]